MSSISVNFLLSSSSVNSIGSFAKNVISAVSNSAIPIPDKTSLACANAVGSTKTSIIPSSAVTSLTSTSLKINVSSTSSLLSPLNAKTPVSVKLKIVEPKCPPFFVICNGGCPNRNGGQTHHVLVARRRARNQELADV